VGSRKQQRRRSHLGTCSKGEQGRP
jgi:hypothetical protein